jgi:hypothetical protein
MVQGFGISIILLWRLNQNQCKLTHFILISYEIRFILTISSFPGALTLSIQNGIKIRIPNGQLVVDNPTYNEDNGKIEDNSTTRNIVINALSNEGNEGDLPLLGRLFLSSAYLMVNHDEDKFTLWQAETEVKPAALKAVAEDGQIVENFCANSTNGDDATPASSSNSASPTSTSDALSGGAIAGIAFGGVGAIAILTSFAYFFLYRRRKRRDGVVITGDYKDSPPPEYRSIGGSVIPQYPLELAPEERATMLAATPEPSELHSNAVGASGLTELSSTPIAGSLSMELHVETADGTSPQELDSTAVRR